jgi:hypothetical protein
MTNVRVYSCKISVIFVRFLIIIGIDRHILLKIPNTRFNENLSGGILNLQTPVTERLQKQSPVTYWI